MFSSIRAILLAATALTLAACATTSPPQAAKPSPAQTPAPAAEPAVTVPDLHQMDLASATALIKGKLRQNGQYLFCDQRAYLDCYQIGYQQCLGELAAVKSGCLDKADARFPAIQSTAELEQYSSDVSSCLAVQHAALHREKMQQLSSCIRNIDFDPAQRDRSLFK